MRRKRTTRPEHEAATGFDFDTPTPARLRHKMVDYKGVMLRLTAEFPRANLAIAVPFTPFDLLNARK
jgi:hypothetical protein